MSLTSPASNIHSIPSSKGSSSPWTKSPLAFSVLDSHTKNVWSQPDGRITTKPTPSGKIENSLEGIPDDFVAALPRTLNDFNADNESVKEEPGPFSARESPSYISPSGPKRISPATADDRPSAQAGTSAGNSIKPSPNGPDERSGSNSHGLNRTPSGSGTQGFPGSLHSPSGFQVPPGYQLVPIGTVPPNPQPTPYSGVSSVYPGQGTGPWSPSPTPQPPSGFARSPQLYSLNANFPPPLHPIGFSSPHSANQTQSFNKTPGPIAPRGARPTSSGMPSPHLGRPTENNFVPAVGRNGPANYLKSGQTSAMANNYGPGPPPALNSSIDLYGSTFAPFQPRPPPPHPFSTIHPGLSPQNLFSPSLTSSSSGNMFLGSSNHHPGSGVIQSYLPSSLHPPSFTPQLPPHFQSSGPPQPQPQQPQVKFSLFAHMPSFDQFHSLSCFSIPFS